MTWRSACNVCLPSHQQSRTQMKAEQTRLLLAAISFFFFFLPPPEQLFSSEDFLQCETGSAAAWETGGGEGAGLLPLPFFPPHERGAEALSS